jgi:serine/threonine-protein kinase HipA
MKKAKVFVDGQLAGYLEEIVFYRHYRFTYIHHYQGQSVSLEMPIDQKVWDYNRFPPFFEGLLPEGLMLEALLKKAKLDRNDYFEQLIQVGQDCVGNVTVEADK